MTELLARVCARKPFLVIAIWGVVAIVAGALAVDSELGPGPQLVDLLDPATTTELKLSGGAESSRAERLLEDRLRGPTPVSEIVIVQSGSLTVDDEGFRERVDAVFGEIASLGADIVTPLPNYYQTNDPTLVSVDRRTTIMPLLMTGSFEEAVEGVEHVVEVVEEANGEDGFRVLIVGDASISHEQNELAEKDLRKGERIGIPVALVILVVLFGTIVAVLMPIGLALVGIIVALGITALIGQVFDLVFFVTLMIIMIGLAVGIDYSILIISRFRDEMARGLDKYEAIERAGATAGRTVLFSGVTVVIALCGMLIVPFSFFQSLGLGAILVVLVTLAATFTFLPANLAIHGTRLNLLPVPFLGKRRTQSLETAGGSQQGFWEVTTRVVMRYPVISVIAVGVPMIAATVFYFQIETGLNGVDAFPEGAQTREAFFVMEEQFSFGLVNPTDVVIDGDIDSPAVQEAVGKLQASLAAHPGLQVSPQPVVNGPRDLALLTVLIPGEPGSRDAVDVVSTVRDEYIPAAFDGVDAEVLVGGVTAVVADTFSIVRTYTPIVFAFVLGFSFLILMLVFRSIVIPIKAVIMNLLSVGMAYGLLVLVFQKGVATDLLGFQHAEVIDVWIPLFLFSILFGLSMDYHVFLLSRIRERYDQAGNNAEAVSYGLRSTAGIITGAALIMVAVFGAFASGDTIINQQVGFGLAIAVLLDATLVRSVLVPASMEMLGTRNWYLPPWLRWLPDLRVEPSEGDSTDGTGAADGADRHTD
ncbi:MAG: MMPL family transporter [Dehalococcoidia bacterium]|nr:MMPL family transporter [Dehalococcoidia bacterium]